MVVFNVKTIFFIAYALFCISTMLGQTFGKFDGLYNSYTERMWPNWNVEYVYQKLDDSRIVLKVAKKGKIKSETIFNLDSLDNVVMEVIVQGANRDTISNRLVYSGGKLMEKSTSYGLVEKYSDFTPRGKPRQILRNDSIFYPFKEVLEYDERDRLIRSSFWQSIEGNVICSHIRYTYNKNGDVSEIKRNFEPAQKFPVSVTGGRDLYPIERVEYRYNGEGFWTRKYSFIDGKKKLVAKRKFFR